ncbi:MAG: glycerophosphodiester phosphodiesterase family protein [Bacteroidota bacterium]
MYKLVLLVFVLLFSCQFGEESTSEFDVQGHRGARGIYPENTITGFIYAINTGVTTLEMDVVVSGDNKIVLSHEPFFSPMICLLPGSEEIPSDSVINLYKLSYQEIKRYDCGSGGHPFFQTQQKAPSIKPLLSQVLDSLETYIEVRSLPKVKYNIELKSKIETDHIFHPEPSGFSDLVLKIIQERDLFNRVTLQSFDFRILQYLNQVEEKIQLSLLIENELTWQQNIDSLGFVPDIYSSYYPLIDSTSTLEMQKAGMKVIPWTVNEYETIEWMLSLGVDGIISDYPLRVFETLTKKNEKEI